MQYISVELIALLEAVVYNFSQGTSETFEISVFLCNVPSNIQKGGESMYDVRAILCIT